MKKIIILHNEIVNNTADELDVLAQRDLVLKSCSNLGFHVTSFSLGDDLKSGMNELRDLKADVVFNLVEASWGKGELIYFAPAMLNSLKIAYTGLSLAPLFLTTNKVLAKQIMQTHNLPTASFFATNELDKLNPEKKYILKPIWEEASVGISEDFIFTSSDTEKIDRFKNMSKSHYFAEEFIEGREFNISMIQGEKGPEVLPPAEIIFSDYFIDKPKIVGYKAKWDENSEEYKHTIRAFGTLEKDPDLYKNLMDVCTRTWHAFNLNGYVRIDFRIDKSNNIYILEINGNPCISPDSGFIAAIEKAGYTNDEIIERILNDLN